MKTAGPVGLAPKPGRATSVEPRLAAITCPPSSSEPSRTCPNCGAALFELKCKLLCPNRACGYYLSCSDFY